MLFRQATQLTLVSLLSYAVIGCVTTGEGTGTQNAAGDGAGNASVERLSTATSFDGSSPDAIVVMGILANDVGPVTVQALWESYDATARKVMRGTARIWMRPDAAPTPGERPDIAHAVFAYPPANTR